MHIEHYLHTARDGYPLAVTAYRPATPRYRLLINSATGINQRFYQHFAQHAARQGAWVFSYDYRGIAASNHAQWSGSPPSMSDWGRLDLASMLDHMPDDLPLAVLGHSVGGQLPGLADNAARIQALLGVAAQSGYWRLWPGRLQPRLALNWYLVVPVLTRLMGHLPGRLMGGESLPAQVALEWARWCRNPAYLCDASGQPLRPYFDAVTAPTRFVCFTDDQSIAPERAVRALAGFYRATPVEVQTVDPNDWHVAQLGHFGFFRRQVPVALWNQQLDWLASTLELEPLRLAA